MARPLSVNVYLAIAFLAADRNWPEEKIRRVGRLAAYAESRRQSLPRLGPKSRKTSLKRSAAR